MLKRNSIFLIFFLFLTGAAFAADKGSQELTRYEVNSLADKTVRSKVNDPAKRHKIIEELKSEVVPLLNEAEEKEKLEAWNSTNQLFFRFGAANLCVNRNAVHGPSFGYRLISDVEHNISANSSIKLTIDTMDAGLGTTSTRGLATKMFSGQGKIWFDDLEITALVGPGTVVHLDPGLFPSENNAIFIRPKPSLEIKTRYSGFDVGAAYVSRQVSPEGNIGVNEITAFVGRQFKPSALFSEAYLKARLRYLWATFYDARNSRAEVEALLKFTPKASLKLLFGTNSARISPEDVYVNIEPKLDDPFNTGTELVVSLHQVGSAYRDSLDKYEFIYLNSFNRLTLDGTVDLAFKMTQKLSRQTQFVFKADRAYDGRFNYGADFAKTYTIIEYGFTWQPRQNVSASLLYRYFEVPSKIDQFATLASDRYDSIMTSLNFNF